MKTRAAQLKDTDLLSTLQTETFSETYGFMFEETTVQTYLNSYLPEKA